MASEAMSPRERLRAAFAGEPTDRVPWSPCLDGYFLSSLPEGDELDEAGVHRAIGADALLRHIMLYTSTGPAIGVRNRAAENPRIDFKVEPTPEGGHRIYYETAVGTIWEELISNPQSPNIPWFTKRKLETVEDVKIYMYALETSRCDPHPETFRRVVESLDDAGLVTTTGPISPMEQFINLDMDVENVTYALADDPDTMEACFALMHEANLEAYQILAESEAEVVISYENLSTTLTHQRHNAHLRGGMTSHGGQKHALSHTRCGEHPDTLAPTDAQQRRLRVVCLR